MQTVIIILIALAALVYLSRGLWQKKSPDGRCGGGGCSGCSCGK